MTRSQRHAHLVIWLLLVPVFVLGLIVSVFWRLEG